ncbi:MAG: hypothetical protein M1814_005784 [Vezdaea aestivalis]|nr:MAG: hypothetical protein M1814_005784 [Vezdaea aestivalis]
MILLCHGLHREETERGPKLTLFITLLAELIKYFLSLPDPSKVTPSQNSNIREVKVSHVRDTPVAMDTTSPPFSGSGSGPEEIPISHGSVSPTPPTSHAAPSEKSNRRKMNVSETSTSSSGSVEIATTERFRVGAPSPLRMLPLIESSANPESKASQAFIKVEAQIRGSLWRRGISDYYMNLCQLSEPEDEAVDSDHTILIRMEHHTEWVAMTNDILEITEQAGVRSLFHVELRDPRATLEFFVPDTSQSLEAVWSVIRLQILAVLKSNPGWRTLDLLNTGLNQETSRPTVVVGLVRPVNTTFQRMLHTSISQILSSYEGIDLTFVRASKVPTSFNGPSLFVSAYHFGGKIYMGSSMGVEGGTWSGTLGGFLIVSYNGQEYVMGLTNHHVIENKNMTSGIDEHSYGLRPSVSRQPTVVVPSIPDKEKTLRVLQSQLQGYKEQISHSPGGRPSLQAQVEMLGSNAPQAKIDHLALLRASVHQTSIEIEKVTNASLIGGTIFASSGNQRYYGNSWVANTSNGPIRTGWATDWALVIIDTKRLGGNLLHVEERWRNEGFLKVAVDTKSPLSQDSGHREITTESVEFGLGQIIFKKSRDSNTAGVVSHLTTDIFLNGMYFSAHVVAAHGANRGHPFLRPGDSGSWCVTQLGSFHSLAFGGNLDAKTGSVIRREDVYKDIEEQTGAKIVGVYKLGPQQ